MFEKKLATQGNFKILFSVPPSKDCNLENISISSESVREEAREPKEIRCFDTIFLALNIVRRGGYNEKAILRVGKDFLKASNEKIEFQGVMEKIQSQLSQIGVDEVSDYIFMLSKECLSVEGSASRGEKDIKDMNRFFAEVEIGALERGELGDVYKPQENVERWIGKISEKISEICSKEGFVNEWNVDSLVNFSYGVMICVKGALLPIVQCIADKDQLDPKDEKAFGSISFKILTMISEGVVSSIFYKLITNRSEDEVKDFVSKFKDFSNSHIKMYGVPGGSQYDFLKNILNLFNVIKPSMQSVASILENYINFKKIRPFLEPSQFLFSGIEKRKCKEDVVLPFGEVFFILERASLDERSIILHYDSRRNIRDFMVDHNEKEMSTSYSISSIDSKEKVFKEISYRGFLGASIDDNDKVYFGCTNMFSSRILEANYVEIFNMMLAIESAGREIFIKIWQDNPTLFTNLDGINPICMSLLNGNITIFSEKEYFDRNFPNEKLFPMSQDCTSDKSVSSIIAGNLNLNYFISLKLQGYENDLEGSDIEPLDEVKLTANEQEEMLWKKIHSKLPNNGWFTMEWLEEKLKLLGNVSLLRDRGKGSHSMMQFSSETVSGCWTVSLKMSKTQMPFNALKNALKSLKVPLEAFYDVLD